MKPSSEEASLFKTSRQFFTVSILDLVYQEYHIYLIVRIIADLSSSKQFFSDTMGVSSVVPLYTVKIPKFRFLQPSPLKKS
jgi:hypothetical protein